MRVVPGLDADAVRRQGEEIAEANERLAPFRVLRGIECDILPDGSLDLPDDVLAELDWVQLSLHAGQRAPRRSDHGTVTRGDAPPGGVRCLSHPTGRLINHRPPNALDLERAIEVALEEGVALEVNGLPDRLDLRDEHVRLAVEAGVQICSTDAHSVRGLGNMRLAVATARRGGAQLGDVLNTQPLEELPRPLTGPSPGRARPTRAPRTSASRAAPPRPRVGVLAVEDVALEVAADRDVS